MLAFALAPLLIHPAPQGLLQDTKVAGRDCEVRVLRSGNELIEEIRTRDSKGASRIVLLSPSDPRLQLGKLTQRPNAIQGASSGLFQQAPTFAFTAYKREGNAIILSTQAGEWKIEKRIAVPPTGNEIDVMVRAVSDGPYPQIRYLLSSYAFAPDGQRMSAYGKPDSTWAPAFRPGDHQVIGDHFFRAPAVVAQKGGLAATLMPNLDVLTDNRPIPTIIDLDCKNGVVDAPLMSYGFADYKLIGHVYFANDASMVKPVPWDLQLGMKLLVDAKAEPMAAYRKAPEALWNRYGARYFDKILPQAMPFADYARVCYPAAFNEKMTGGWFEHTIDGHVCGGVPAGWGLESGWVSWQGWFNQLRSAWGLRWWGKKLGEKDWVDKADKMLNLALAAPMNQGAVPTTYLSRTKSWKGTLISPSPDCYYDLTNMAWKGIWMMKWMEFPDCPRRDELEKQLGNMAALMVRSQAKDGSFPTWLTKDLKVVPILDRSAQSALPTLFLGCYARAMAPSSKATYSSATLKGAEFLAREIVPKQRYYDFETFFSCSPKECLQRNGAIDNLKMWDHHTMQAPQNTLSMHWTAEALRIAETLRPTPNAQRLKPALAALDIMSLYQNVWPISYRKVAYTYGGFGVQNSDGEYNDARQAQFGSTLCDFGAQLGRKDYFQRGVAAIRASLTLINHPKHIELRIYPNPNYPLGLEPENDGHGGTDQQNGRTGFDWGEGSGLAAAAEIMDKYGSEYRSPSGWTVKIDATPPPQRAATLPDARALDMTNWRMPGWTFEGDFLHWPTRSTRLNFNAGGKPFIGTCEDGKGGFDDEYTGTITSPLFLCTSPTIHLKVGGGAGPGVYVELLDGEGQRIAIARGKNTEFMDEVVWQTGVGEASTHSAKVLQIRIVDKEKGGWGHINVGDLRAGKPLTR